MYMYMIGKGYFSRTIFCFVSVRLFTVLSRTRQVRNVTVDIKRYVVSGFIFSVSIRVNVGIVVRKLGAKWRDRIVPVRFRPNGVSSYRFY